MATIDFGVCVGRGHGKWAEFLRETAEALKSGTHTIRYMAALSGHKITPSGYSESFPLSKAGRNADLNHMNCLITLAENSEADFLILADADNCMCIKGWDDIALSEIKGNCVAFGYSLCDRKDNRYAGFPYINWICLRRDKMIECKPEILTEENLNPNTKSYYADEKECHYFGYSKPVHVPIHTCWKFCVAFTSKGYTGYSMPAAADPKIKVQYPQCGFKRRWHEHHYKGDLFGSHMCNSHRESFENKRTKTWIRKMKEHINNRYPGTL